MFRKLICSLLACIPLGFLCSGCFGLMSSSSVRWAAEARKNYLESYPNGYENVNKFPIGVLCINGIVRSDLVRSVDKSPHQIREIVGDQDDLIFIVAQLGKPLRVSKPDFLKFLERDFGRSSHWGKSDYTYWFDDSNIQAVLVEVNE